MAILGLILKRFFQNVSIIFTLLTISDFVIFLTIYLTGRWVVIGLTDRDLLYMIIATFLVLVFFAKYSVIPAYLLFKKYFLDIGPLISLLLIFFLKYLKLY